MVGLNSVLVTRRPDVVKEESIKRTKTRIKCKVRGVSLFLHETFNDGLEGHNQRRTTTLFYWCLYH